MAHSTSNRFNTKNLDLSGFCDWMNTLLPRLLLDLKRTKNSTAVYTDLLESVSWSLKSSGAYRPSFLPRRRRLQTLWLNPECERANARRHLGHTWRTRHETRGWLAGGWSARLRDSWGCKTSFLRGILRVLDLLVDLGRVERTIMSLFARSGASRIDRTTDPSSPIFQTLREELICPHIPPVDIPLITEVDESNPINGPLSDRKLSATLGSYNVRLAPGLNGVSYGTLLGLLYHSSCSKVFF